MTSRRKNRRSKFGVKIEGRRLNHVGSCRRDCPGRSATTACLALADISALVPLPLSDARRRSDGNRAASTGGPLRVVKAASFLVTRRQSHWEGDTFRLPAHRDNAVGNTSVQLNARRFRSSRSPPQDFQTEITRRTRSPDAGPNAITPQTPIRKIKLKDVRTKAAGFRSACTSMSPSPSMMPAFTPVQRR